MKSGMENKAKGKLDEVAGKIKQAVGEATNNQSMANRGAAQQVKGKAKPKVKIKLSDKAKSKRRR